MNEFFRAGIEAMANDEPRFVKTHILAGVAADDRMQALAQWFAGWDFANMAAKVEGWSDAENEAMFAATGNGIL